METTLHFLDAVKARHGLQSDYALAPILGITRSAVSRFRSGKDFLGDSTAIRVAELLEINPALVVAAVHRERAKQDSERAVWTSIIEKLGGLAASVLIGVSAMMAPPPAYAGNASFHADDIRIMRSYIDPPTPPAKGAPAGGRSSGASDPH